MYQKDYDALAEVVRLAELHIADYETGDQTMLDQREAIRITKEGILATLKTGKYLSSDAYIGYYKYKQTKKKRLK